MSRKCLLFLPIFDTPNLPIFSFTGLADMQYLYNIAFCFTVSAGGVFCSCWWTVDKNSRWRAPWHGKGHCCWNWAGWHGRCFCHDDSGQWSLYIAQNPHLTSVALSGIASQNATQIDPPCDSKCHVCRNYVGYKKPRSCLTETLNITADDNAVIHSSILVSSILTLLARHIFSFQLVFWMHKVSKVNR